MSEDQITATIVAKLDGPAVPAAEDAEPAVTPWPALGQGERGTAVGTPSDALTDAVLEALHLPPTLQLGRGDR